MNAENSINVLENNKNVFRGITSPGSSQQFVLPTDPSNF